MLSPEGQVIQSMFQIISKESEQVDFILKPGQRAYDENKTRKDLIPKSRQEGFSSLGIGYQVVDCLTKYGSRCVLISHESKATQRLLDRARYYLNHIKGPEANMGRTSRNELYFKETESTYYIGTAGAKAFGRGDTITHLHISEYAWWESDALEKVAGLFQAVPKSGTIRIESTGNGRNNDFYYMCMNAKDLGYKVHFHPWYKTPEYTLRPSEKWVPRGFEDYFQDVKTKYDLSDGQMYWYWVKLLEFRMDLKYLQQEYPSSLEECFQATGGAVFPNIKRSFSPDWKWKRDGQTGIRYEYMEGHPNDENHYILGADPAGGTGNDDSAIIGICVESLEQVLEFYNNQIDPIGFAFILMRLGFRYNKAFLVPEANKHGHAIVPVLQREYPTQRLYKRAIPQSGDIKYGYMTTEITKNALVGKMLECLDLGLAIYGEETFKQLRSFEEDPDNQGKYEGRPKDDLTMAFGMACVGLAQKYKYRLDKELTGQLFKKPQETFEGVNLMYMTYDEIFPHRPGDRPLRGEQKALPSLSSMLKQRL
jgi:hypothetical protein